METALLRAEKLSKRYRNAAALEDFDLRLEAGESLSLFGPNGVGKTTLMHLAAGILAPDGGELLFGVEPLDIGFIPQDYRGSLFPWFTVRRNIAAPLLFRGATQAECTARVDKLVEAFGLDLPLDRYPYELSGGQQQLVVNLRGFISDPRLFLFDEPFASLDYPTTLRLRETISKGIVAAKEQRRGGALLINHDLEAAIFLADRVLILVGPPMKVVEEIRVDLPWPRRAAMLTDQGFLEAREKGLKAIEGAVG